MEKLTIAINSVVNSGTAQAIPHHGLAGAYNWFAGGVFYLLQNVERANAATAEKDSIGVIAVYAQRKIAKV
jgi:hypothetical protein